jgi:hypothetical protein
MEDGMKPRRFPQWLLWFGLLLVAYVVANGVHDLADRLGLNRTCPSWMSDTDCGKHDYDSDAPY